MDPEEIEPRLEQLYESAKSASSEGLVEEALKRCEEALLLLDSYGEDTERHSYSDFVMLVGDVHWGAGDYEQACQAYHKVVLNDPERIDARIATGVALYHLCRFSAAQNMLELASIDEPEDGEVWYYLGLLALRQGKSSVAMRHFAEAHELDEERFVLPVETSDAQIAEIVEHLLDDIPEELRAALHNVPIVLERHPDEELLLESEPPMDPMVLGLFEGTPITAAQSTDVPTSPTRIVLYAENIWLLGADQETLEEELFITLKHEIGHYFGLSEDDLTERGLD